MVHVRVVLQCYWLPMVCQEGICWILGSCWAGPCSMFNPCWVGSDQKVSIYFSIWIIGFLLMVVMFSWEISATGIIHLSFLMQFPWQTPEVLKAILGRRKGEATSASWIHQNSSYFTSFWSLRSASCRLTPTINSGTTYCCHSPKKQRNSWRLCVDSRS